MPVALRQFRGALLRWYAANARDLPWRRTHDAYRIWVSEIMLQQTRVAAVLEHYARFLHRFPDVRKLAAAREASVLAAWSGLGYYRRAPALHRAAKVVVGELGGRLPRKSAELHELPGFGRYTAAAVASIAFDEPVAVLDGNVERVLLRLSGLPATTKELWALAQSFLDPRRPGDFNQAMMELGATVCAPKSPACKACPVFIHCATRGEHPTTTVPAQIKKEVAYALGRRDGAVRLVQRPASASLMPLMWELPQCATNGHQPLFTLKHSITNTDYRVGIYDKQARSGIWVPLSRLSRLPLTGLARKVLAAAGLMHPSAGKRIH